MKERPILFSTEMVQAIMDGRKTQTRRIVKPQPIDNREIDGNFFEGNHKGYVKVDGHLNWQKHFAFNFCPYGKKGNLLYVRETWAKVPCSAYRQSSGVLQMPLKDGNVAVFKAGWDRSAPLWRPSIQMPKEAARIWLQVTDVRVERLQDISEDDAIAEGVERLTEYVNRIGGERVAYWKNYLTYKKSPASAYESFESLWQSIYGKQSWDENPFVWVIEFKVLSITGKPIINSLTNK